jgi:hypothetical protein
MVEPHCMNCNRAWDRPFLDAHLSHSWCQGGLRKHREAILFDRERSLLPVTQEAVAVERQKRRYGEELPVLHEQMAALQQQIAVIQDQITLYRHYIRNGPSQHAPQTQERRQFIAACPKASCRGFLSSAYKCGTCDGHFCSQCREPKEDEGHTCDPTLVETIKEILRDSRPCPTCGTAISRVSGCDQMFCTQCSTAFSYAKGTVITGVIHNPHYFERMRALGGAPARQPGDNPCGGWPRWWDINNRIPQSHNKYLAEVYRWARHVEQEELTNRYPTPTDRVDNTDLRVRYLLGEITEAAMRQHIQRRDRTHQFKLEVRAPLELYVISTLELFQEVAANSRLNYETRVAEFLTTVETLCNAPLRAIADRYKLRTPQFSCDTTVNTRGMLEHTMYNVFRDGYKPPKRTRASSSNTASDESDSD